MTTPETDLLLQVAVQIPIVAVFIWFTLRIIDVFQKQIISLTEKFLTSLEQMQAAHDTSDRERDAEMQRFIEQSQSTYNAGMARLAEEVKSNTSQTAANTAIITRHDAMNNEFFSTIVKAVVEQSTKKG